MEVSTHDNVSYDIVMVPSYSKGNKDTKEDNSESNKASPSTCDAVNSVNQVEEELQLYEIPSHEFSAISNSRDAEESYIYY